MNFLKQNYKYLILLLVLIASILYLTQSYTKKIDKLNLKISEMYKSKLIVENKLKLEIENNIKLKEEIKKKNKKTKISIVKNTDGSSKKDIEILENSEDIKKDLKIENKENKEIENKENKEIEIKAEKEIKTEKVEIKKNNFTSILLFVGGIAVCFATGICVL